MRASMIHEAQWTSIFNKYAVCWLLAVATPRSRVQIDNHIDHFRGDVFCPILSHNLM